MINILSLSFSIKLFHSVFGITFSFTANAIPLVPGRFNNCTRSKIFFPENCLGSELMIKFIAKGEKKSENHRIILRNIILKFEQDAA